MQFTTFNISAFTFDKAIKDVTAVEIKAHFKDEPADSRTVYSTKVNGTSVEFDKTKNEFSYIVKKDSDFILNIKALDKNKAPLFTWDNVVVKWAKLPGVILSNELSKDKKYKITMAIDKFKSEPSEK